MPIELLHRLEIELLCALNWNVYVSQEEFFAKLCTVEHELALTQGCARGWLTYTELVQLIPSLRIAQAFVKYSAVFALSYTASVFTIAGAFLLASQVPGTSLYRSGSDTSLSAEAAISSNAISTTFPLHDTRSDRSSNDTQFDEGDDEAEDIMNEADQRLNFKLPELLDEDDVLDNSPAPTNDTGHLFDRRQLDRDTFDAHLLDDTFRLKTDLNDTFAWNQLSPDGGGSCQAALNYGPLLMWMQFM